MIDRHAHPADVLLRLWAEGQGPDVDGFLARSGPLTPDETAAVLRVDQRHRWEVGQRVPAEEYLARHPLVRDDAEAALDLIFHEYLLRERLGPPPVKPELLARFPGHAAVLADQIDLHLAMAQIQTSASAAPGHDTCAYPPPETPDRLEIPGYEVLGILGRGGMGVVYRARQTNLDRVVALKVILGGGHHGSHERERFQIEALATARLSHPNIIRVYEVGEDNGRPYLSLEYVCGGSLGDRLRSGPLPALAAAALVETLARAVQHAHEKGVVHRDLKPANVLMTEDGVPRIADFGIARRTDADGGPTQTGVIVGTPGYMAPEQARGATGDVGPGVDVYALGGILYECLVGRPPFPGRTPLEMIQRALAEEPVPPRRLQPDIPRDLETVCLKCLEKSPARRYASAGDLADDLRRLRLNEPIHARPPGTLYLFGKFASRHRVAVAGVAAVFVALVAGVIGTGLGLSRARAERNRALEAESEARDLLAASHVQAGRLAMSRGAWREALTSFDQAQAAGRPDTAEMRLQRVRAWWALHEPDRAAAELEALALRGDLGPLAGSARLWRADLALARSSGDEAALGQVRAALDAGLGAAEAAYARGLLARTSPEAARQFEAALDLDPYQPRAHAMLANLLILMGRLPEARERVGVARLLFPDDPTFNILSALAAALQDDPPAARRLLEPARRHLAPRQLEAASSFVDLAGAFRRTAGSLADDPGTSRAMVLLRGAPLLFRARTVMEELQAQQGGLLLPVPPVLLSALRPLAGLVKPGTFSLVGRQEMTRVLTEAAEAHPDGVLLFWLGLVLAEEEQWEAAERTFLRAASAPSVVPIQGAAGHASAVSAWILLGQEVGTAREQKERRERALAQTYAAVSRPRLSGQHADQLSSLAANAGEFDVARVVVVEWGRRASRQDPAPARRRLAIEMQAGDFAAALKAADAILARWPADGEATRLRGQAIAALKKHAGKE